MRILILGMDGYLGWPTAMYFAKRGHTVYGVDNYFRRNASMDLNMEALIPTPNLHKRVKHWNTSADKAELIGLEIGDITDYNFLKGVFKYCQPDVVIHYAEQPSGPYSMINRANAEMTIENNLTSTLNLAYAVKETNPGCHIIKLGTAGEYGESNVDIPEGWFTYEINGREDTRLFPRQAGSLYHTTKIMDTDMLWFYVRIWGLCVTDLMQGPVYGIVTDEMYTEDGTIDTELLTNFHYDEVFGTVINRFLVQALVNHPLTVYGEGGQTRGYLNIRDTMQCVYLAAMNPPPAGKLEIYNQMTETFSVNQLAEMVKEAADEVLDSHKKEVVISHVPNPRVEKEEHYYNPTYTKLLDLGLQPNPLTKDVLKEMLQLILPYKEQVNKDAIFRGYKWK